MIYTGIRQLCAMSVLCGAALTMCPEGGVKRVTETVCTAVLLLTLLSPFAGIDLDFYALSEARRHEAETELFSRAEKVEERLNRIVIEGEYAAYIMDKAAQLGMTEIYAEVTARWELDGLWVPYSAQLSAQGDWRQKDELGRIIRDDLGIPFERQQWHGDG